MAKRTTVNLVDDLDGTSAAESVQFGVDGATYEIDLSGPNAVLLRDTVAPYIAAARRVGGRRSAPTRPTVATTPSRSASASTAKRSPQENQRIRAWAMGHGAFVPERGRIPGLLVTAFEADDPSLLPAAAGASAGGARRGASAATAPPAGPTPEPVAVEVISGDVDSSEQPRGRDGLTATERERVRAWAVGEGIEVKTRGQLKKDLIANHQAWTTRQ